MKRNFLNKKAVHPVIATALLLVVTVITLVLFNTWFQSYSSNLMADVETQSSVNAVPEIETVIGDFVYIKTPSNLTIDRILVDGDECETNVSMTQRMQGVNISDCLDSLSTSTPKITLITDTNIVTTSVYLKDVVENNGNICNPICSDNIIYDSFNDLYWTRNLSLIGLRQWSTVSNATYSEPTWNETTETYIWPNGLTENDYPAFRECLNLELDGYTDWRLPTIQELLDLGNQEIGGWGETNFTTYGFTDYIDTLYWSSNESSFTSAWVFDFDLGIANDVGIDKASTYYVLCIR